MAEGVYQFRVGSIDCWVISDGSVERTAEWVVALFNEVPAEDVQAAIPMLPDPILHHYNCLVFKVDDKYTLVDTGSGRSALPVVGKLYDRLLEADIKPEMIDTVIITHCHGDHINGLVDDTGELVYPNAAYLMHRDEWEHWMNEERLAMMGERANALRKNLLPIADKLSLIDDGEEVATGVSLALMPGHSPGHSGLVFTSDGEKMVHIVDVAHLLLQLPNPSWSPRFDTDRQMATETRKTWLKHLSDENTLTLSFHLPFPGLGHVLKDGAAYLWQPI